jgi:hypothetical protein
MNALVENQPTIITHKRKGLASFLIGVISLTLILILLGIATAKDGKLPSEHINILILSTLGVGFFNLVGVTLGVFGALDRSSKKVYPALGLILNIGVALFIVVLLVTPRH